jgi:polysaccharide export outer membrane protein
VIRLALIALAAAAAWAQVRPVMEEIGGRNLPEQKLGVDDLVAVSVYDAPELTRTVRIEQDGTIHLPLLGEGIAAAGVMPRVLETRITQALKSGEILVDPIVKVTVAEYHSRPVSVMGAVRRPVTFQAEGVVTLLDALARAEGLTAESGTELIVTRGGEVSRIAVKQLFNDADPTVNLLLTGGEEIRVPEAGKIFVVGNVARPGAFPVRDPGDHTVLKLVALSEGLTLYAEKIAYIVRRDGSGAAQEIPVELSKIMKRQAPDIKLEAGDILYIPDNTDRRTAMTILDRIANFGVSTASGVLIWRR